jgi:hypothetical protein
VLDIWRLLVFPVGIAAGWMFSAHDGELARKAVRGLMLGWGIGLLALVASGWFRQENPTFQLHGWLGHGMLIYCWLTVPVAIGTISQWSLIRRPIVTVFQVMALLALLGAVLLASLTGYLPRGNLSSVGPETRMRFVILHEYALPIACAVCGFIGWRSLRANQGDLRR